jgi:hypothetical protein
LYRLKKKSTKGVCFVCPPGVYGAERAQHSQKKKETTFSSVSTMSEEEK